MGSLNWSLFLCSLFLRYNFAYFTLSKEETRALEKLNKADAFKALRNLEIFGKEYGNNWLVLPDGNGIPQIALLQSETGNTTAKESGTEKIFFTKYSVEDLPNFVTFTLYSGNYSGGETFDLDNLKNLNFDSSKPTKLIVHGWRANNESTMVTEIRNAYLTSKTVNVITVDWGKISQDIIYPSASGATEVVGTYVASMVDSLAEHHNVKHKDIHIVGHSLGAHVSGFIGSKTKQQIGRITGLDPALPGFQNAVGPEGRLDPSDANFVDVIHTTCGTLGLSINAGHADFFPNGGSSYQPGCSLTMFLPTNLGCSHSRAHQYFAESIKHPDFKAVKCSDWDHFKKNECEKSYNLMGEYASPENNGMFFLKTHASKPFAMDLDGIFF